MNGCDWKLSWQQRKYWPSLIHEKKISADASKDGLGAVLYREIWRPAAYASRTMTPSECRYSQIEKECLDIGYGLEKSHSYVFGLPTFVAETDYKPLIAIIKKNLNEMSPRIQWLMMKLQRYDLCTRKIHSPSKCPVQDDHTEWCAQFEFHRLWCDSPCEHGGWSASDHRCEVQANCSWNSQRQKSANGHTSEWGLTMGNIFRVLQYMSIVKCGQGTSTETD